METTRQYGVKAASWPCRQVSRGVRHGLHWGAPLFMVCSRSSLLERDDHRPCLGRRRNGVRRPVSRVLSGASRPLDGHSSATSVAGRLTRPTRAESAGTRLLPAPRGASAVRPYSVLLPVGFAVPRPLPARAVRSCRTVSPLPAVNPESAWASAGGLFSVALSLGLPPPGVTRHRVPVEPGLSSPRHLSAVAERGRPAA